MAVARVYYDTEVFDGDSQPPSYEYQIQPSDEFKAREELTKYLTSLDQGNLKKNIEELLTVEGGFLDRFNFVKPFLCSGAKKHILVSGCAVGSELILARNLGFQRATGTEVAKQYVDIGRERLASIPGVAIELYDGQSLPFVDHSFSMIASGHIIEHTPAPFKYFREHMRVLEPGGLFFIEFPDRYHPVELHTGVPSVEWLPSPLRELVLRFRSSRFSGNSAAKRSAYKAIRKTLRPMSVWQIKRFIARCGRREAAVIAVQRPAPGFTRVLIRK